MSNLISTETTTPILTTTTSVSYSPTPGITNVTNFSASSTVQTSMGGSNTSTAPGITNGTYYPASSGSTVQTSTDDSNTSTTVGITNGTYSAATSDHMIQTSTDDSNMSPTQEGVTVTRTITITSNFTMSSLSQTANKLINQTDMLTSIIGHVAEVTVHPTSGPSSSVLDESSHIAIGSVMAGLGVFGIASLVVYRLVCIGKKIIPAVAR